MLPAGQRLHPHPLAGRKADLGLIPGQQLIVVEGAFELGRRVRAVTEELNEEKIDIVDFSTDLPTFVSNALSPAKVSDAFVLDAATKAVRALVPDFQLSLAIGKEGQNARLAAMLTRAKIDVKSDALMDELL